MFTHACSLISALLTHCWIKVLAVNGAGVNSTNIITDARTAVWSSSLGETTYVALFNMGSTANIVEVQLALVPGLSGKRACSAGDVWASAPASKDAASGGKVTARVPATGVILYSLTDCVDFL